jgi:hypothetical protein
MKTARLAATVLSTSLITTHGQLVPFLFKGEPSVPDNANHLNFDDKHRSHQRPMNPGPNNAPGIQLPNPDEGAKPPSKPDHTDGDVILSDVLGSQSDINIFAGLTHGVSSITNRLESSKSNTTLLAPLNKAITSLPRKPWEDPRDYAALGESAYAGSEGEDRAQRNMRRFVEAHVVAQSPWAEGEKVESVGGGSLWWERGEDGKAKIFPGGVKVERVAQRVANGEVWVLGGVVNYAS